MSQSHFHLAQINIARAQAGMADPIMADFIAQLEPVNRIADKSPGFIWRLQTEDGDATSIKVMDDPAILVNMSVWESIEALRIFTYQQEHLAVFQQRKRWFTVLDKLSYALWWQPIGELPSVSEGIKRLELLWQLGPTPEAFSFKKIFPSPEQR